MLETSTLQSVARDVGALSRFALQIVSCVFLATHCTSHVEWAFVEHVGTAVYDTFSTHYGFLLFAPNDDTSNPDVLFETPVTLETPVSTKRRQHQPAAKTTVFSNTDRDLFVPEPFSESSPEALSIEHLSFEKKTVY